MAAEARGEQETAVVRRNHYSALRQIKKRKHIQITVDITCESVDL